MQNRKPYLVEFIKPERKTPTSIGGGIKANRNLSETEKKA
jgi:hypothetical protein